MALEIIRADMDRISGHLTLQVRVREVDATGQVSYGPLETAGIDHESLTGRYDCKPTATAEEVQASVAQWLAEHHATALTRKRTFDQRASVVHRLAGTVLNFEEAAGE